MSDITRYEPLWGTWYVESLIGQGGFGKVYKIRREVYEKTYYSALKVITIPHDESEIRLMKREGLSDQAIQKFLDDFSRGITSEIELMSKFRGNSHIVSFEDYQIIDNRDFFNRIILIRMELLMSLSNILTNTPLPQREVVKLGIHICRALELCAMNNIIHRDVKPDNIFVSSYGDYKLGDFGIARQIEHTMSGLSKKGTNSYMAPEVFKCESYGAGADIYSLGIVLYCLLNQHRIPFLPAFPANILTSDREAALHRRISGEPLPALGGVSPELNALVLKACAYNRQERFSSPTEMREQLELIKQAMDKSPKDSQVNVPSREVSHDVPLFVSPKAIKPPESMLPDKTTLPQRNPPFLRKRVVLLVAALAVLCSCAALFIYIASVHKYQNLTNSTDLADSTDSPTELTDSPEDSTDPPEGSTDVSVTSMDPPLPLNLDLRRKEITNEKLVEMIKNGEIPQNVTVLNLSHNYISDISPLRSLKDLQYLDLAYNNPSIKDFTPLASLTGLLGLNMSGNMPNDFAFFGSLTDLREVSLDSIKIDDVSFLTSLTGLTSLSLNNTKIRDITFTKDFPGLTKLRLNYNNISDITPLTQLKNLKNLSVENNNPPLSPAQIASLQLALPDCNIVH